MLTKYQFVRYAGAEMQWHRERDNYPEKRRLEVKLDAYDDMLTATDTLELAKENSVHIDVIADIAHLHQRYGLEVDFYANKDILYEWSVNYTKTCIKIDSRPSSIAAAKFINRLPSQIVATTGNKIPVHYPD